MEWIRLRKGVDEGGRGLGEMGRWEYKAGKETTGNRRGGVARWGLEEAINKRRGRGWE